MRIRRGQLKTLPLQKQKPYLEHFFIGTERQKINKNKRQNENKCFTAAHPCKLVIQTSSFHGADGNFANRHGHKQWKWQRKEDIISC